MPTPKAQIRSQRILAPATWLAAGVLLLTQSSCGGIGLGANPYLLENAPEGSVVYTGLFFTQTAGKTVTGTAKIYRRSGQNDVLRLESLSAPAESPLKLRGDYSNLGSTGSFSATLKSSRGNQNYDTGVSGVLWNSVSIRNTIPTSADYATASLAGSL